MKLSQYAKNLGIHYRTAWNMYVNNQIPNAFQLPTGTIIVPEATLKQQETQKVYKKEDLVKDFSNSITEYCTKIYGIKKGRVKAKHLIKELKSEA